VSATARVAIAALNSVQAAELTGITVQGMASISKSADPPPKGANGYDCREFGQWLKRRHLRGVGVDSTGIRYDYDAERARLTKAQADKTELEARELQGEMVVADAVIEEWARMLGALRARLLSIPSKTAPRARGAQSDEHASKLIEAEVLEALQELSDDGLPERTRARRTRGAERTPSPAQTDGESMGG
jgi:phage terminase Nu1 subunit (DNA packaging protein)